MVQIEDLLIGVVGNRSFDKILWDPDTIRGRETGLRKNFFQSLVSFLHLHFFFGSPIFFYLSFIVIPSMYVVYDLKIR